MYVSTMQVLGTKYIFHLYHSEVLYPLLASHNTRKLKEPLLTH
jgi:hypothetical protein